MADLDLDLDGFLAGRPDARALYDALATLVTSVGDVGARVSKSQVAFTTRSDSGRPRAFAWAWMPDRYLGPGHAPLVLTLALRRRDPSPRWKQVVEPAPGRFTHHLELTSPEQLDPQVRGWVEEALRSVR